MGTRATPYTVDTKGCCFLCLKLKIGEQDPSNRRWEKPTLFTQVFSVKKLASFLKVNFQKIFNMGSEPMASHMLDQAEVLVTMCRDCSFQSNQFIFLQNEVERLQHRVSVTLKTMTNIMKEADEDPMRKYEYRRRLACADPVEIIQSSIAEKLRMELAEKCSSLEKTVMPSLQLLQRRGVCVMPVRMPNGIPQTRPFMPPSTSTPRNVARRTRPDISRMPTPTPTGSSNLENIFNGGHLIKSKEVQVVEVVNLDTSDTEEPQEPEEESELIISSVTGANGVAVSSTTSPAILHSILSVPLASSSTSTESKENDAVTQSAVSEADSFLSSIFGFGSSSSGATKVASTQMNLLGNNTTAVSRSQFLREVGKDEDYIFFDNGRCQCQICGKVIGNHSQTKEAHKLIHQNKKPLKCIHCPSRFRNISNLKAHILGSHRVVMLSSFRKPEVRPEVFESIVLKIFRDIMMKLQTGDNQKPWPCKYCGRCYTTKPALEAHMIQVHFDDLGKELQQLQGNISDQDVEGIAKSNSILPTLSDKVDTVRQRLGIPGPTSAAGHYPQSSSLKSKCRICNKICEGRDDVRRHYMLFHGVGNTAAKSTLARGTTATGNLTLSCPYCSMRFRFQHSIRVHVLNSHRYEVFRQYLPLGTTDQRINAELTEILEDYKTLGNNTFGCNFCTREFTKSDRENRMIRNHVLLNHFGAIVSGLEVKIGTASPSKKPRKEAPAFMPARSATTAKVKAMNRIRPAPSAPSTSTATVTNMKVDTDEDIIEILPD